MKYNPKEHHRRSIRLKKFDYTQQSIYFITVCTYQRQCILGKIINKEMILNELGSMVESVLLDMPKYHEKIRLGQFVIMPNHIHVIIAIKNKFSEIGPLGAASCAPTDRPISLGEVIRKFKSISTVKGNKILPRSNQKLWQTNYYEKIIRCERQFSAITRYIEDNPKNWEKDIEFIS